MDYNIDMEDRKFLWEASIFAYLTHNDLFPTLTWMDWSNLFNPSPADGKYILCWRTNYNLVNAKLVHTDAREKYVAKLFMLIQLCSSNWHIIIDHYWPIRLLWNHTANFCSDQILPQIWHFRSRTLVHIAGLNRGVPMGRSTQIMGGSFRQGLNSEVVTFLTKLAVQPSPLCKSNGEKKSRWQHPIFVSCLPIGPNSFTSLFRSSSLPWSKHNVLLPKMAAVT